MEHRTPLTSTGWVLRPGDRVGRFVVTEPIGRGGMAELHLARSSGLLGRWRPLRVIKTMLPNLEVEDDFVSMFRKEARIAATLRHPGITRVLGFSTQGKNPHLVLEYVDGADLRTILEQAVARFAGFDFAVAIGIVRAVARALHHAHETKGRDGRPLEIVHRDVTPSNVLLSRDGSIKLTDFGIAKTLAVTRTTRASWLKGKAGYMSPEQCLGGHVDRRSDVFALGILLYETTTGYRAFYSSNPYESTNRVLAAKYERPTALLEGYPRQLEAIIDKALSREREDRYATAAELERALAGVARRLGLVASRADRVYYLARVMDWPPPASRRKDVAIGVSVASAALAGVAVALGMPGGEAASLAGREDPAGVSFAVEPVIPDRPANQAGPAAAGSSGPKAESESESERGAAPSERGAAPSERGAAPSERRLPRKPEPKRAPASLLPPSKQREYERRSDPLQAAFPERSVQPAQSASQTGEAEKVADPGDELVPP